MTHRELQTMLKQLSKYQKNQISQTIQRFLALSQELTEIEPDTCPCCGDQNAAFIRKGILRGKQRFQCKSCGRKFTYDTKQLTSNSHQPMESWIVVLEDTLSLVSLDSTAEKIGVCHTTAFRMRHKLMIYMEELVTNSNRYVALFLLIAMAAEHSATEAADLVRRSLRSLRLPVTAESQKSWNILAI